MRELGTGWAGVSSGAGFDLAGAGFSWVWCCALSVQLGCSDSHVPSKGYLYFIVVVASFYFIINVFTGD